MNSSNARRRLAEAHLRSTVYRDQTLQLSREGVGPQDPRFVNAFMEAKRAQLELEARLGSRARAEILKQNVARVRARVEEQEARRRFLLAHRRYLDPVLPEQLDEIDDRLADQEDQLEEATNSLLPIYGAELSEGWMSQDDRDLLTTWQMSSVPGVQINAPSGTGSSRMYDPSAKTQPGEGNRVLSTRPQNTNPISGPDLEQGGSSGAPTDLPLK
ncbi:tegument protein [Macropodid alphaherpesvirus 2]|uniref:Tegument protein n=1 Tax=Macropodid alphaherpesvirus 2 TaxID=83440 RepID=A0AAE7SZ16_9ALPH|nr:tegument protein [Macropodid alphaherpesvirus 2]QOD40244.1 tegument protein [Macropodid alphaherpesvirus 2]WGO49749.1 tegument protein [Macropodid alphaherpesvirus 2]